MPKFFSNSISQSATPLLSTTDIAGRQFEVFMPFKKIPYIKAGQNYFSWNELYKKSDYYGIYHHPLGFYGVQSHFRIVVEDGKIENLWQLLMGRGYIYIKYINLPKMQAPDRESEFHEETDTFNLTVSLSGDRLAVTLRDLVDWTIYSKEYTEDDVGGEIHKKMDLSDLLAAFMQAKTNCSQENANQKEEDALELKRYQFGTVVKNQGYPCYKIDKGGKLTVYFGVLDRKTKQELAYESNLTLNKVRAMTEMEIINFKADVEKKNMFEELNKKILKQEKDKVSMLARIVELEEKNNKLTQQVKQFKTKTQQLQLKLSEISERFQQKIIRVSEQLELQTQRSMDKFVELEQQLNPMKEMQNIHSLAHASSQYFSKEGLTVRYVGANNTQTHYIFNKPIGANEAAKFKLRVTKTQNRYIPIGVVDYAKQKDQGYSHSSGNALCYGGSSGYKWPESVKEGDGFKEGDVVEVEVNRANSTVKYSVNGTLKATHSSNILADNTRVFHPLVQMCNTNDAVEWLIY